MDNKAVKLELSIEEVNAVLNILASQPYNQVVSLIGRITAQANEQAQATESNE